MVKYDVSDIGVTGHGGLMRQERRLHRRYPVAWGLKGKLLTAMEPESFVTAKADSFIRGEISDIGGGGLCLVTNEKAEPSTAMRCEIFAPHVPVGIPTLLQVRWVREAAGGRVYTLGLQFVV
jgi:hypothetical protein